MISSRFYTTVTRDWPRIRHIPVEVWIACIFSGLWLAGVAVGLPVNWPAAGNTLLVKFHFIWPVMIAAIAQLLLTLLLGTLRRKRRQMDPFLMCKLFPFVVVSVFLYFNFKAWMPLVNPRIYDAQLQAVDEFAAPVLIAFIDIRQFIAASLPFNVDNWYSVLYFAMFFLSLGVHAVMDTPQRQRQLVFGMCLNLILGGIGYWILPAEGPFLYREGVNRDAFAAQQAMHIMFQHVQATYTLPPGYFTAALGAMPSLHIAHSLFFTLCAARSARPLLIVYIPILFWIVIEAAASGWHYLADLPAGALLAILSFFLASKCIATQASTTALTERKSFDDAILVSELPLTQEKSSLGYRSR